MGNVFSEDVMKFIRSSFSYLEEDMFNNNRLFFENSGGSLRLKSVTSEDAKYSAVPDSSARTHKVSVELKEKALKGIEDIKLLLNAKDGVIAPFHTASKAMLEVIRVINENISGGNIVTTSLDHPSSYDACHIHGKKTNKEVRVAEPNSKTGAIEVDSIMNLIDEDTFLLSVILTSNITGAVHDIQKIIRSAREINPEIYIVVDAVQYAAHGIIDIDKWQIDALTIAPYKMFGNRGVGFAYLSERVARLPHNKLIDKDVDDWTVGSISPAMYASFSMIINYIVEVGSYFSESKNRRKLIEEGLNRIILHEQELLKRLINGSDKIVGLKDMDGVTLHFPEQKMNKRDPIVAISFNNITTSTAVMEYEKENIIVGERAITSPFSKRILDSLNIGSIIRVSPIHCHSLDEIDLFLKSTKKIASM